MPLKYMFIDLIMFVLGKQNKNTEKENHFFNKNKCSSQRQR